MAASSFLDSEATFVQQAKDAGLTQPWIEALRINQLVTFAKLSFAVTSPGVMATDEQVTRFLNTMRDGTAAAIAELGRIQEASFREPNFDDAQFPNRLPKGMMQRQSAWHRLSARPDWKDNVSNFAGLTLQELIGHLPLAFQRVTQVLASRWTPSLSAWIQT